MRNRQYSVLMSMYHKDKPEWAKAAIDSILAQTVPPTEFVIVKDGPLGDALDGVIAEYEEARPGLFRVVALPENVGSGLAKKAGVECCTYDFVAIMDADDISLPARIEKSFEQFERHPELDVVGCLVDEFIGSPDNVVAHVVLPETHEDIVKFAKKRCPLRHSSLLMRKKALIQAGGYRDFRLGEDYDLAVRIIQTDKKIYNIQNVLQLVRVNEDFYKRRGGVRQLKQIYAMKKSFLTSGFLSRREFLITFVPHAIVILMPGKLREWVYGRFLRG